MTPLRGQKELFKITSLRQGAHRQADVIRPQNDREHSLPETKMQKTDREQPSGKPGEGREPVLFYLYLFHTRTDNG